MQKGHETIILVCHTVNVLSVLEKNYMCRLPRSKNLYVSSHYAVSSVFKVQGKIPKLLHTCNSVTGDMKTSSQRTRIYKRIGLCRMKNTTQSSLLT